MQPNQRSEGASATAHYLPHLGSVSSCERHFHKELLEHPIPAELWGQPHC
jgi:hypothetical protein